MTLIEAIKQHHMRISDGRRWLHWTNLEWVVYERKYNQKKTREILRTEDEHEAVKCLLEEEG